MGYNKELLNKALNEIIKSGEKSRHIYEKQKRECVDRVPRLAEIEQELMQLGPMLGVSALAGYTDRVNAIKEKCSALSKEREDIHKKLGLSAYKPKCQLCDDSGYVKGVKLCECVIKRARELSFAALSAEMPINECSFNNFNLKYYADDDKEAMQKVVSFCKKYAKDISVNSKSVMFFGGTGLGKTHLSLAIASAAIDKGMGVVYSPAQNLLQKLEKEHFSYSADTPFLDDVLNCDLLILDDLGAEFITSFSQALIYNIINTRLLSAKPTIISTNLSIEELTERYTPRVTSRIIGCYTIKQFKGSDIRQQKRIEEVKRGKNND